jgi:protein disulfide-isomerase A1
VRIKHPTFCFYDYSLIMVATPSQALPAMSLIDSSGKSPDDFFKSSKLVMVGFFDDATKSSPLYKALDEFANGHRDLAVFGYTLNTAAAKAQNVSPPNIVLFKQFDEGKDVYTGGASVSEIKAFFEKESEPLIEILGKDNFYHIMGMGKPIVNFFYDSDADLKKYSALLTPAAQKYKDKIVVALIDANLYGAHAPTLNLNQGPWPAMAIQDILNHGKYPYDQSTALPSTSGGFLKFIEDFLAGKLEASVKSEPIPETNNGPVTMVVARNYDDILKQVSDKDIFLEIYARKTIEPVVKYQKYH